MALVSPGVSISINDQSQYVNSNVGSIPLVVLATAQDKTYNGSPAAGTSKANAGKLLAFTSQRDLVTQMGAPSFQLSSAGSPVNGSEINEYGLLAAYSALGLSNQLFAIRADIDLNQLVGTSVRPVGAPSNGTYWLDTLNTSWGVFALNATTNSFTEITPLVITNPSQVSNDNGYGYAVPTPLSSVGQVGQYALVTVNTDGSTVDTIRLFYKAGANSTTFNNTWVQVGSTNWQNSTPAVTGRTLNPTITSTSTLTINGQGITTTSTTTPVAFASSINNAGIAGVSAVATTTGQVQIFVTNEADNGSGPGTMTLTDGTHSPLAAAGIDAGTYRAPGFQYSSFASVPTWFSTDTTTSRPTGSIWWKTTSTGSGFDAVLKQYNSSLAQFTPLTVPAYSTSSAAILYLDPVGGGTNIANGQVVATYDMSYDTTSNGLRFLAKQAEKTTTATGGTTSTLTSGQQIDISATQPGQANATATITLSGTTAGDLVSAILEANIPYVTATLNANDTITIIHTAGGEIVMSDVGSGTLLADAGFSSGSGVGFVVNSVTYTVTISNLMNITMDVVYQNNQPYSKPESGTYWYYSNPADIDIMINDGAGWKGYRQVAKDARGFNLVATDSAGVIITPSTAPTSQSSGAGLQPGDLWLDSGDLANFPSLYRYTGAAWVAIDNTDHTSSNGIIFADARWDTSGTTDPVTGALPPVTSLLTSPYIDQDAPDYRLYPRGTLLFNTRRSGYNVKKFVANYFNSTSFPNAPTVPGATSVLPDVKDAWLSASGADSNNVAWFGSKSQRNIVTDAMQAALDSNLDVLSPNYQFNLICAPNYPELIPNMLTLNDNRGDTAFVIGDTPLDLAPNTVDITNWTNNTTGNGLPTDAAGSPYLALYYPAGRTNDLSGNQVVVPASHAVLRTYLYNDNQSYPWFAPAGTHRGLISNMSDIGYISSRTGQFVHNSISQGMRDALSTLRINPLTQLPNSGLVIWGQLTRSSDTTARNRVNVVRLENYLRSIFSTVANGYLFEPNDAITRKSIASQVESALNNILAHRGLYDFLVICDTSNNTPSTIANNQLYVDVAIEPMRDVEFIYIPIAIYNPGSIAALNTTSS
jgi:hypothetical protein